MGAMHRQSTRRRLLQAGGVAALGSACAAPDPTSATASPGNRIRLGVSTYSYWHFTREKYPIEQVIDHAAALGFDGVEILHRR